MRPNFRAFFTSSLTGGQRGWHWVVGVLLALLLANSLFLLARRYGFGCSLTAYDACSVSGFYQASVLLHSLLGIVLVLGAVGFVVLHVPRNLEVARSRLRLPITGGSIVITLGVLLWSGIYFLFNAKTEDMNWLYYTHLAGAALVVLVYFGHRALARPPRISMVLKGGTVAVLGLTATLILIELGVAPQEPVPVQAAAPDTPPPGGYRPPTHVAPGRPFFPSPVTLASGGSATRAEQLLATAPTDVGRIRQEVSAQGYASKAPIGAEKCARCHADTVEQWASSAHRFSSFNNPFYVATLEYLRETPTEPNEFVAAHLASFGLPQEATGRVKSRWCAGCHDPLLILTGRMHEDIDKGSVAAQAGLTCLSCHAIAGIPNHTGNGNYIWNDQYRDSYIFSQATSGLGVLLHDMYLKANPERHVADLMKPVYKDPEYCATCHKVSLDRPVNDYRWLRGQNEYDAWHNSGVAHNAARTFYLPPSVRKCQDCHMPLVDAPLGDLAATDGKVRSHRFLAANTALPWLRGDTRMVAETEKFLRGNRLRLFVGGVLGGNGEIVPLTDGAPHGLAADTDRIELHVVVRNLNVGHTFPGGTNDSNEAWLEVTAAGDGKTLVAGGMDAGGHVSENTRIYNLVGVDRQGRRIDKRNAHELVAPIYVAVIPPGTADLSRYSVPLAELGDLSTGASIQVRLLWRKFNRAYTEFAFAANREGFAEFEAVPELPVTEIAATTLRIERNGRRLMARAEVPESVGSAALAHDYAIGFLRQGDFKSARQVIDAVLDLAPKCVNCLRTRARIEMAEGRFEAARRALTEAEQLAPADPQSAWLWARVLVREGNYDAAAGALDRVLEVFPQDRMAHKLKARVAYLDGRFRDSLRAVATALAIDAEDATVHYYAMLAHRALGNTEQEQASEAAYRYHKADETAQQATLAFRRTQDEANFAAQRIKVFRLR